MTKQKNTYEITDTQIKENYNKGTALKTSVGKLLKGLYQFYSRETSSLTLMQLQITNIYSVRTAILYLISETSQ